MVANATVDAAKCWSWREELNLQPVVYKLDQSLSDTTHEVLTPAKNEESEKPSS